MPIQLSSIPLSLWWRVGCISGASAVALGAFGAHALKARGTDPSLLKVWETGTFYHFVHALGLLLLATRNKPSNGTTLAAGSFALGTTLFSGSLYLLTLTEQKAFGAITPIGGTLFIVGWLLAAFAN